MDYQRREGSKYTANYLKNLIHNDHAQNHNSAHRAELSSAVHPRSAQVELRQLAATVAKLAEDQGAAMAELAANQRLDRD